MMKTIEREQDKNKYEGKNFDEFSRLMYRTAALPQQAREKVAGVHARYISDVRLWAKRA